VNTPLAPHRTARIERSTSETRIAVTLGLDGTGQHSIATGVGFLDHMLVQIARHGLFDLTVDAQGDLHIDDHHTTEDVGITLGQALDRALGDRRGIRRYGHAAIPMDETLVEVAIDLSGRPHLEWHVAFQVPQIGRFDTQLVPEWFRAFAMNARATLHVTLVRGTNAHHVAEACWKALARALRAATEIDPRAALLVPSSKGSL